MKSTSKIELSKSALRKNINYLKKRIGKKARFCSVIKGNAYGHGVDKFIPIAEQCGVHTFAVSDAFEAERALNSLGPDSHLIIMAMIDNADIEWAIENDISFFVFET
ncbi:MAG: alanine racemase, partial [Bacteroidota bacterium]